MKLIIFDIDGTLTNTAEVDYLCYAQAYELIFGLDVRSQKWENIEHVTDWGITEELVKRQLNRQPTEAEYAKMQEVLVQQFEKEKIRDASQFKEIPGSAAFFERVKADDSFGIGVATGCWERTARLKMGGIGLSPDGLPFGNSDHFISRAKITEHAMEQAREQYGRSFEEIIYFGDGEWDYKTCKQLGIRFIGIDVFEDGKLAGLGAETVFSHFENQEAILSEL